MERICIFIDAGNFYHLVLKKLGVFEINFNFDKFAQFLIGNRQLIQEGKRFYVGTVREKQDGHESKTAMSNQTSLFTLLKKAQWVIKTSKLRTRVEKVKIDDRVVNYREILAKGINKIEYLRSREKGIDVNIAVDLVVGAIENKYDTAIIVSSDTDLEPAMKWAREHPKKKIEYVGFSIPSNKEKEIEGTTPPNKMLYGSDIQRVLIESDLHPFIKKSLKFKTKYILLIKSLQKRTTWRLFDDKNLAVGDIIDFIEVGTNEHFATAKLTDVVEKPLGELTNKEKATNQEFKSEKEMYIHYKQLYKKDVTPQTLVKIISFELTT